MNMPLLFSITRKNTSGLNFARKTIVRQFSATTSMSDKNNDVVVTQNKRRRRRHRTVNGDIPSYAEFVHRFTVISLYRNCLKAVELMPTSQLELKQQVQQEFRAYQNETDSFSIRRALAEGQRKYGELQELTGYRKDDKDTDSWLNTDDPEDPRGRVGQGWPWNR